MRTAFRWICAAGCAAVVCTVPGCRADIKDAEARIKEKNVLTVAVPETDETGERREAALLEDKTIRFLAEELGVELVLLEMPSSELQTAVQERKADVAAGFVAAEEQGVENCSISYGLKGVYLVEVKAKAVDAPYGEPQSQEEKKIAVSPELSGIVKTYVYSGAMGGLEEVDSAKEAARLMLEGKAGGYVCYEQEAREMLKEGKFLAKDLGGAPREGYVFLADREGHKLLNVINRFLTDELMN
ncbi:extracellular solute-binding protein (family 3) [Hungatella effluvii]|uniref:Extracellular solute-binding protein (Family 3) n=1 Tax=Hungatella effluvii TaxID=1096246 RepID=A0A2V3Y867_9FIRM|nr:transporter substrate-binding domain-containing protein [Hungatella effluvii]PXX54991.1 extracellular solute-binding protein (family 3) [Hungatella effluvii]